jgi:hypothetical protein
LLATAAIALPDILDAAFFMPRFLRTCRRIRK